MTALKRLYYWWYGWRVELEARFWFWLIMGSKKS